MIGIKLIEVNTGLKTHAIENIGVYVPHESCARSGLN